MGKQWFREMEDHQTPPLQERCMNTIRTLIGGASVS